METPIPIESSKVVIEVVRTKIIKPLTPTPDHLKRFGMAITDHVASNIYMPMVFFYSASGEMCVADRNQRLKESLSKTLSRFYPLAGRIDREGAYVDCDDIRVEFVETKVTGCSLVDILRRPDNEVFLKLLPCDMNTSGTDHLLRVQSNVFECGGMAVGTSFSHLIMDGCGRGAFLKDWTAVARGDAERRPPPDLDAIASRFPAVPNGRFLDPTVPPMGALRRFVFDGIKIKSLRDRATSVGGVRPTRVQAVTAFIYKCMVNSLTTQLGHETRPSIVYQQVNIRSRFDPPFPETSLGNMISVVSARSGDRNEFVNDAPSIIAQFKEGMRDLTHDRFTAQIRDLLEILKASGEMKKPTRGGDKDMYMFSSLCGFGYCGSDFGWGKPVWISIADLYDNNVVIMIDAREGGGIEAWITLPEEHVTFLETNTDFLEFASLNPPISFS